MATAFEIYLRTGRRIAPAADPETKYNPWHDLDDGRFTFAGQGRHFPSRAGARNRNQNDAMRGRGGSFGGGGAGASWKPNPRPKPVAVSAKRPRLLASATRTVASRQDGRAKQPYLKIPKDGYDFLIDAHVRPRQVSGELTLQSQPRSRRAQADAGKPDRRTTDDGGHFIATRFNGPREWFNHFAQDANFNRGAYRDLEDKWAKAIRSGKRVFVDIVPRYRGTSMRPHLLIVTWTIDGKKSKRRFANERGGQ